jgi:hypothetical protein
MTLRNVFSWLHLATGMVAGAIAVVMVLACERQIISRIDRDYRYTPPAPAASRLSIGKVAALQAGFSRWRTIFVGLYTDVVLSAGSPNIRVSFQTVTVLRGWLALAGVSGLYLWSADPWGRNGWQTDNLAHFKPDRPTGEGASHRSWRKRQIEKEIPVEVMA